ncbi:CCHC-type domain-containing protein [Trichonephila clavipes]|nr:CCHC-type domain-containing protein [Trichonephila clavipes]
MGGSTGIDKISILNQSLDNEQKERVREGDAPPFLENFVQPVYEARHTSTCCKIDGKLQYYCSLRKVNSFESLCDLIISDKLFETLNKETATHIGIREAEDWFRPIDLAKECDIYISSRSGSHKEIPITGYTEDPFKNRSQNFKPKFKENYPQYLERENKNCFICGDSSHCARDSLAVETEEKEKSFEQTSRTLERKISMRSTKDQLVKKDVLMPVKHNVFLWNLPDVEEMPSHDGETV